MEIASCSVCYIQRKLVRVDWRRVIPVEVQPIMAVLACWRCFPEGDEEAKCRSVTPVAQLLTEAESLMLVWAAPRL